MQSLRPLISATTNFRGERLNAIRRRCGLEQSHWLLAVAYGKEVTWHHSWITTSYLARSSAL